MLLFLLLLGAGHSKLTISPQNLSSISVNSSVQFKANLPAKWSLAPGSPGTIDEKGIYHAPASMSVHNNLAGCQLLPNDHVLNTRIDALPVSAKSPEWLAEIPDQRLTYYPAWGTNIADSSTPRESLHFSYSPENDGKYEILPWPELQRENGVFSGVQSDVDRHVATVDRESCNVFEVYNNYAPGENAQCSTCTAQGGVTYSGMSYRLPKSSSDAAGLFLEPLTIRLSEIRSGNIQHAARCTLGNRFISPSSSWPSRAHAGAWGKIPYGTRFRLRRNYDLSGFSPVATVLLKQLKEYGMFLADGGANWEIETATDVTLDAEVDAALLEIRDRGPHSRDLEAIDESSLMVSEDSGEIDPRNHYVKDDGSVTIIATDANDRENRAAMRIPLQGITVGVPQPSIWIQSGVQTQFTAWVKGSGNATVNWSMTPALGTLSSAGAYSAPKVDRPTTITLTAASAADQRSTADIAVTVMPPGPIRIKVGNATRAPGAPNQKAPDYGPDSEGHMWWRDQAGEISWGVLNDDFSEPWPQQKDISLYYTSRYSFGDMKYRYLLPNGNYKVSIYFAQPQCKGKFPKESRAPIHVETQGQIVLRDFDIGSAIDYACLTPEVLSIPATVKNNSLYFALRRVTLPKAAPSPLLSAYSITPDNSAPKLVIDPESPKNVYAGDQAHFYSVGWYMSKDAAWSVIGPGSIDSDGLYKAPVIPPTADQPVQVEAHSRIDPTKVAVAKFVLKTGDMVIKPASATVARTLSQTFQITFGHALYTNLDWSISPKVGSIDGNGVYSAPADLAQDTRVLVTARSKDLPAYSVTAAITVKVAPPPIRIHCGDGPPFTDAQGRVWAADYGFSQNTIQNREMTPIADASPDMQYLYRGARYRYQDQPFSYHFNLPNGRYSVTLKFADYAHNEPGHYSFYVKLNGKKVLEHFDPDREKGPKHAVDKTFQTTVTAKSLQLDFLAESGAAFINGIEIIYLGP